MASKRPSLFGNRAPEAPTSAPLEPDVVVRETLPSTASERPPSRKGKKIVSMFVPPEASKQLRMLALKQDSTVQALMVEALNDLFGKHGANRIAE